MDHTAKEELAQSIGKDPKCYDNPIVIIASECKFTPKILKAICNAPNPMNVPLLPTEPLPRPSSNYKGLQTSRKHAQPPPPGEELWWDCLVGQHHEVVVNWYCPIVHEFHKQLVDEAKALSKDHVKQKAKVDEAEVYKQDFALRWDFWPVIIYDRCRLVLSLVDKNVVDRALLRLSANIPNFQNEGGLCEMWSVASKGWTLGMGLPEGNHMEGALQYISVWVGSWDLMYRSQACQFLFALSQFPTWTEVFETTNLTKWFRDFHNMMFLLLVLNRSLEVVQQLAGPMEGSWVTGTINNAFHCAYVEHFSSQVKHDAYPFRPDAEKDAAYLSRLRDYLRRACSNQDTPLLVHIRNHVQGEVILNVEWYCRYEDGTFFPVFVPKMIEPLYKVLSMSVWASQWFKHFTFVGWLIHGSRSTGRGLAKKGEASLAILESLHLVFPDLQTDLHKLYSTLLLMVFEEFLRISDLLLTNQIFMRCIKEKTKVTLSVKGIDVGTVNTMFMKLYKLGKSLTMPFLVDKELYLMLHEALPETEETAAAEASVEQMDLDELQENNKAWEGPELLLAKLSKTWRQLLAHLGVPVAIEMKQGAKATQTGAVALLLLKQIIDDYRYLFQQAVPGWLASPNNEIYHLSDEIEPLFNHLTGQEKELIENDKEAKQKLKTMINDALAKIGEEAPSEGKAGVAGPSGERWPIPTLKDLMPYMMPKCDVKTALECWTFNVSPPGVKKASTKRRTTKLPNNEPGNKTAEGDGEREEREGKSKQMESDSETEEQEEVLLTDPLDDEEEVARTGLKDMMMDDGDLVYMDIKMTRSGLLPAHAINTCSKRKGRSASAAANAEVEHEDIKMSDPHLQTPTGRGGNGDNEVVMPITSGRHANEEEEGDNTMSTMSGTTCQLRGHGDMSRQATTSPTTSTCGRSSRGKKGSKRGCS
ncbi:hypothetical protein FRB99_006278 [Tulasnella sp. 403]|nr:hypothetical protein FRB99_006278 [Tulasnella sp. 403]